MKVRNILSRTLAALAFAGLAVSTPAAAQSSDRESEVGTRFSRDKYDGQRGARETLSYFGRCMAGYKADNIRAFLLDPVQSNWDSIMRFPNNESRCVVRDLSSQFADMRGALAEGWYLVTYKDGMPASFSQGDNVAPSQEEVAAAIIGAAEADRADVVISEFARCVVAVAPVKVDALLRTRHASKDETVAIRDLSPSFAPCAFEGQKLGFDQAGLRHALSYALARRAVGA